MKNISRGPSLFHQNRSALYLIVLLWQEVAQSIEKLKIRLAQEDFSALGEIRKVVLNLTAPMQLVRCLYMFIFVAIKT